MKIKIGKGPYNKKRILERIIDAETGEPIVVYANESSIEELDKFGRTAFVAGANFRRVLSEMNSEKK